MPYQITPRGVIVADAFIDDLPVNERPIQDDWYEVLLQRSYERHRKAAINVPKKR